jgi:hypothetical protein
MHDFFVCCIITNIYKCEHLGGRLSSFTHPRQPVGGLELEKERLSGGNTGNEGR